MSAAAQTCIITILVVQGVTVQMLGSGEGLAAVGEVAGELLLDVGRGRSGG